MIEPLRCEGVANLLVGDAQEAKVSGLPGDFLV